jgi:tripartite-type tricarboxylate transporter receptor subunit TctC
MTRLTRRRLLAGGAASMLAAAGSARAQNYPSGPVKVIIGVGPGSSADVICRLIADKLTRIWGQQALVINQPGGGGAIGIRAAGNAAPDGGTLYMSLASNYILLPQTQATLPFNVARDFVPIGFVGDQPLVITVAPALGVNTLPELIALAKKKPGALTAAAGLAGSALHLTAEWLKDAAHVDFTVIHYPCGATGPRRSDRRPYPVHRRQHLGRCRRLARRSGQGDCGGIEKPAAKLPGLADGK